MNIDENNDPKIQKNSSNRKSGLKIPLASRRRLWSACRSEVASQLILLWRIPTGSTPLFPLHEVNRQSEALYLFDRAIELARDTPGVGFPYMAYEVKAQALTTLEKGAQARALLEETLAEGRAAHRLDTEAQVQTQLGEIELKLDNRRTGVRDLEAAGTLAQRYGFHRITAEAMFDLYGAYRQGGDLNRAEQCLRDGLAASMDIGHCSG